MSIRKRQWTTARGEEKTAWVVDYVDQSGKRRLKTFARKKDADQFAATAKVEVREGVHVADSASATVKAAGDLWIAGIVASGRERATVDQYRQHLRLHIEPFIGGTLLAKLTVPAARDFEDRLRQGGRSPAMVRKVMTSLSSLVADAEERGLVARNVIRDLRGGRKRGTERKVERRAKGKLRAGVDIPTPEEIKALVGVLQGRWRPLLLVAIFGGLRASELRGLRWSDIDLDRREIHVRQRADRFNHMGPPKSEAGERTIRMPPLAINALREWRVACPKGDLDLAFPNGSGRVESLGNIINRGLVPAMLAAGVADPTGEVDDEGRPVMKARYSGMHALRHWFASWCINRRADGGLELPPKTVQERLGHSSITMTLDVYGHLFPSRDDGEELADAERALLA
ncbi:tyrosine-type recombinase/integrase [Prosthecomicrobium pneumaticum]|uniref:Integrase n=1 Tax=Prosthecomicrobium pneumaticum TaxID=81895 RepID=A0A7W9FQV8_9HYPH|nr:site-specific integrase [Prosthecomicrobium pneumaticum]MBB5755132.1 integrase [Prosthecomicrobium pneumaticum]